jgi:phosphoribosylformylglycinamidine cyclo-ligase
MNSDSTQAGLTYESCGVSIEAQDEAIAGFRERVEQSHAAALAAGAGRVLAGVGSFGAAFAPDLGGIAQPVLISSTDGIGTKVRLHARFSTHEWAGEDLVAATMNDVLCQGARPLFFLDYFACHKVDPAVVEQVVGGMANVSREIGCALVGGEIAEMGDTYKPGEYDLAGFAVGLADGQALWGAPNVQAGDELIGLGSSGVHCNGFSLVRRLFEPLSDAQWREPVPELEASLHDALLRPTRSYAGALAALRQGGQWEAVRAAAHISGGGLPDNLPRSIPDGLCAVVDGAAVRELAGNGWALFDIIRRRGHVAEAEMWRVFNMGVGFVLVVAPPQAAAVRELLQAAGYSAQTIGSVEPRTGQRFDWRG